MFCKWMVWMEVIKNVNVCLAERKKTINSQVANCKKWTKIKPIKFNNQKRGSLFTKGTTYSRTAFARLMTCKSTIISKNKCDLLSIKHWFLYSFRNPCYTRLTMIDLNSSKFYRNSLQLKRCNSWWVIRLKCNWCKENWRFSIWMREILNPRQKSNSIKK